ncbi:MAG: hypothetical protein HY319_01100 [Armatimonadetes bacterium]|nr:hypothetical protein [Armatimonadota bacterium]
MQRTFLELEERLDPGPEAPLRASWAQADPIARERMTEGAVSAAAPHLARIWWDGHPDSLRRLGSSDWTRLGRLLRTSGDGETLLQVARQASALRAAELLADAEDLPELRALARAALPHLEDRRVWQLGAEVKELEAHRVAVSPPCGRWGADGRAASSRPMVGRPPSRGARGRDSPPGVLPWGDRQRIPPGDGRCLQHHQRGL